MPVFLRVLVFLYTITTIQAYGQSVLSNGEWYKLSIETDGVYKIDYQFLKSMGLNPDNIDPRHIQIYGNGAGMLPQPNNTARPSNLLENSILISGESDGKFDAGDYILFYAQGADSYHYDDAEVLQYERHIYADQNYYFLTVATDKGSRIAGSPDLGSDHAKITTYNAFQFYKKESHNLLTSGRKWYSERFNFTTSYNYDFLFNTFAPNTEIKISSAVMAQSFAQSKFHISANGIALGEQIVESIPDFRKAANRYAVKGRESLSQFSVNSDQLAENGALKINLSYEKNNSGQATGYLNYLLVEAICQLHLKDAYTIFRSLKSLQNASSTFEVAAVTSNTMIWDITSPISPLQQEFTLSGNKAAFGTATSTLKEFVVFDVTKLKEPAFQEKVVNQDLHSLSSPDLLIITHPDFMSEARRLANFRISHDNLEAAVVTTHQIYNEFSSGKQDIVAIRDYVKYHYDKGNLRYLLLFGRSSYDYKNVLPNNTNYVPIYQSYNALHPLNTYASDDFYGFLENDEGEWAETAGGNHTLDIGIGRLPVSTIQMAKNVVDKLIRYSRSTESFGSWKNELVFVADDGDNNIHIRQSDQLAQFVDTTHSTFSYRKLYLDAFPQESTPGGERSPKGSEALNQAIERGAFIVNFTGHGGEQVWMQEEILNQSVIKTWTNTHRLPLFVTATCEFSRHDDPGMVSGGEKIVTTPEGGGIAIISTCRPVFSSSNFELNKAFYKEIFRTAHGKYQRLGDVIRLTKNNSIDEARDLNRVGNRNFTLLGDPSLRLNYPKKRISLTAINNDPTRSDTLKALEKITIDGEIKNVDGSRDAAFDGELEVVIYDKEGDLTTLGNESPPYTYSLRKNVLFRGKGTITQGKFSFNFIVPKNISYKIGKGKVSLYAMDVNRNIDASGADIDVLIGGTATEAQSNDTGPVVDIFLGDSTFTGAGTVASNTLLLAKLTDENGINISGYGVGNNITATLDGEQIILNDYYTAAVDTYKKGWVRYPLNDLAEGIHKLTIKAWDNHNNAGENTITFIVGEPGAITISELRNSPNPFTYTTQISFEHNRSGDDLEVNLQIISRHGQVVKSLDYKISNSTARVNLLEWDGSNDSGQKVRGGIYLFRITVRSLADGAKNQKYEKLILIN